MKKGNRLLYFFVVILILLRVAWSLPIGDWVHSEGITLSRIDMLLILILTIAFWSLVYGYLKKRRQK